MSTYPQSLDRKQKIGLALLAWELFSISVQRINDELSITEVSSRVGRALASLKDRGATDETMKYALDILDQLELPRPQPVIRPKPIWLVSDKNETASELEASMRDIVRRFDVSSSGQAQNGSARRAG